MARACISMISGDVMPRRQPRRPSIGFCSLHFSTASTSVGSSRPSCMARSRSHSSSQGRNSCSGGSRRRTVTGRPSMASKMPSKSLRCSGSSSVMAVAFSSGDCARIMRRTEARRASSKNMCSVRTRPMPWAPFLRATAASSGVSALASTRRRRVLSAQPMKRAREPVSSASLRSCSPRSTSPVLPLMAMTSPSLKVAPEASVAVVAPTSRSEAPTTQGLPQPRATTAAWEVMPPREVSMPSAACMPPTSSGEVSSRTRITFLMPCSLTSSSALAAEKAATPTAAPGEAGRPWPTTLSL
mmetsp:Transcript_37749/g.118186  ORF Transcript_37749/g.118186 Transcript_37749/m.118186 type:complete len:299 (-) Transcript_37749:1759-2655(-)